MAVIRLDHTPETIKVCSPLYVILPDPGQMKGIPLRERKVLYLLHGLSDDGSAWQRYTAIETYARDYELMVAMPSFGRSFYMNLANGQSYFSYLVEELPRYLEDVFGIVPRRENTLIAGNSMGGYGALKAALLHPEKYFAAGIFSGVVSLAILALMPQDPRRDEFTHLFGDLNKLAGSEHDPAVWLQQAVRGPKKLPDLYVAVGRQEDLYPVNQAFHAACQALGLTIDYHEEDGRHDWYFWDSQIQRFLAKTLKPVNENE